MTLADFTSPGLILPHLGGRDAAAVIQELGQALQEGQRVPEKQLFCRAVLDRECLAGSDMEEGMAFPHARLPGLRELCFALGRSDAPLKWSGKAGNPVRLVFLMAVPENDTTQYLWLISGLARLAQDRQLVERLLAAPDADQIFEVLQQIKRRTRPAPHPLKPPPTADLLK